MAVGEKQGLDIGSLLQGVSGVAGLLTSKNTSTKTSGGTTTSSSGLDISQEGRMKLIQDILGGSSGLAAVAGGQRASGLYNSTTNQQLVNDLVDRASSSVERDTAKTVSTQTTSPVTQTTVQAPQVGLGTAAALAGGAYGAKKLYDILSGGGAASTGASLAGALSDSGVLGSVASTLGGGVGSDFLNFTGIMPGGTDLLSGFGGIDFLGSGASGFPVLGAGLDLLNGDVEGALGTGAGFMLGNMIAPGVGGPIGSIVSNILPVDSIVSGIGKGLSGIFGGSVVCTELLRQGRMSKDLYTTDVAYAVAVMDPVVLEGYRAWGIPLVRLMRKHRAVSRVVEFFAVNRAHYISAICGGEFTPWRADLGWAINGVGVPLCWAIGKVRRLMKAKDQSALTLLTQN